MPDMPTTALLECSNGHVLGIDYTSYFVGLEKTLRELVATINHYQGMALQATQLAKNK